MVLPEVCVTYLLRERAGAVEVLLGEKKRGLGCGKLVGLGGKLHAGEDAASAAVREIDEEASLRVAPADLEPAGVLTYLFPMRPGWSQRSSVFCCRCFSGEPQESDELVPRWFALDAVPYERMWSDAVHWLPTTLAAPARSREGFRATFEFGADLATAVACDRPEFGLPTISAVQPSA